MINFKYIKYIIIYIIFILGISIISEWISNKVKYYNRNDYNRHINNNHINEIIEYYNKKIDNYIDEMRKDLKSKVFEEIDKQYREVRNIENFGNALPIFSKDNTTLSDEYAIINEVNRKLYGDSIPDKFNRVPRDVEWNRHPRISIKPRDYYAINNTYEYKPNTEYRDGLNTYEKMQFYNVFQKN